jgi:transposase
MDWPANSPDLNPIENIWSILKRAVSRREPQTVEELINVACDKWRKIPQAIIRKTITSMPKRMKQVISRKGNKCDY